MRLLSYTTNGSARYGAATEAGVVDLTSRIGDRFPDLRALIAGNGLALAREEVGRARPDHALEQLSLLPPIPAPEKLWCIGVNYTDRNAEYRDNSDLPKYPSLFARNPSSVVGSGQPLEKPRVSEQLDYEGELVIVIGQGGRHIQRDQAWSHIFGMTLCNEGTVRDWLRHGKFNVTQGKNFDASGSIGPWIETDADLRKPLHLTVRLNGEVTQDDTTASMIFGFADLIAYVTTFMTIRPGDVIVTGTPTKVRPRTDPPRWLKPGDVVEISVPEIGTLRNSVVDEQ